MEASGITSLHVIHPWEDFRNFAFDLWTHLALPRQRPCSTTSVRTCSTGQGVEWSRRSEAWASRSSQQDTCAGFYGKIRNTKIMVVSASKERADAFSVFVKQIIETFEPLSHLRPRSDQRNSNLAFDVGPALLTNRLR